MTFYNLKCKIPFTQRIYSKKKWCSGTSLIFLRGQVLSKNSKNRKKSETDAGIGDDFRRRARKARRRIFQNNVLENC